MKYSNEEAIQEIKKRERMMREGKKRHIMEGVGGTLISAALLLLLFMNGNLSSSATRLLDSQRHYGSIYLAGDIGQYVLVGVLAFMGGVLLTVALLKWKRRER